MNQKHLLEIQYKDSKNLDTRTYLHLHFSTNNYGWFQWIFDHLKLSREAKILELGSGSGQLWKQNINRIPPGWRIVISDFSSGMLKQAQANLAFEPAFEAKVIDAQDIAYGDKSFDAVIANHMLYHIPKLERALAEIYRVLKPGGYLYAATNGLNHLKEIDALAEELDYKLHDNFDRAAFCLENGEARLSKIFKNISLYRYEDSLTITSAVALANYIQSMLQLPTDEFARLEKYIESKIEKEGPVGITKDSGLFVAQK